MKIIDAHLHFSNIESFKTTAEEISFVDYSSAGFESEFAASGVVCGIGMGLEEEKSGGFPDSSPNNPMCLDLETTMPGRLLKCIGINPVRLAGEDAERELYNIEQSLYDRTTVGIKLYAGYYPYYVYDRVYEPVYALAIRYNLPVVIHSGVTYSSRGLLEYSHPLRVDRLAVKYPDITFIISHLGDPWVMDTAAVILKNPNVYGDLSGLIVGDEGGVGRFRSNALLMEHIKRAIFYTERFDRFLFGSDWPLVPIAPYIDFVRELVPEEHHIKVFYQNALNAFPRLKDFLHVL